MRWQLSALLWQEDNGTKGVQEYYDLTIQQLQDLTVLVRTKLTKLQMRTVSALMVLEVHARDVVMRFVDSVRSCPQLLPQLVSHLVSLAAGLRGKSPM